MSYQTLDVRSIALQGRHLIEASAGTGKTYNITRLYLRLLLQRKLSVEQILVVTFTKAATEEIRARIEQEIRNTLSQLHSDSTDPFMQYVQQHFAAEQTQILLQDALLNLDQANIFTIHGFCKRVLTEHAFNSDLGFQLEMEADTSAIALQAVRDAYRRLAVDAEAYLDLTDYWATPEHFYQTFAKHISQDQPIETLAPEVLQQHCHAQWQQLQPYCDLIEQTLIAKHKQADILQHSWQALQHWLQQAPLQPDQDAIKPMLNGNLLRAKQFAELKPLFQAVKQLLQQCQYPIQAYSHAVALIQQCRVQFQRDKQARQLLDFDDLIRQLNQSLQRYDTLATRLGQQYPVALVDEFQDTDALQYQIFDQIYHTDALDDGAEPLGLFMIGDPKQAIYSFRGGDIFTYLMAAQSTEQRWHLNTNYRSSAALIQAYNPLFRRPELFGEGIHYEDVNSGAQIDAQQLQDGAHHAALVLAHFPYHQDYAKQRSKMPVHTKQAQQPIADWCAQEIRRLLCDVQLAEHGDTAQPVQPQHIAILVRSANEADIIRQSLQRYGLSGVYLSDRKNIYHSHEAECWYQVLQAILRPNDVSAMATALATPLLGADLQQVAALHQQEATLNQWYLQFSQWKQQWQHGHFLQMAYQIVHQYYQVPLQQGERCTTNVLHLIELMQQAAQTLHQPSDLLAWMQRQMADNAAQPEHELRLESDENLIRIITYHSAKGLEYPLVFLPFFSWHKEPGRMGTQTSQLIGYHDTQQQARLWLGPPDSNPDAWQQFRAQDYAEQMRLFYVAVTRAVYRCYLCLTPSDQLEKSPLGQALSLPNAEQYLDVLQQFIQQHAAVTHLVTVDYATIQPDLQPSTTQHTTAAYQARSFQGHIEYDWKLASFSRLTRDISHVALQPDHDADQSPELNLTLSEHSDLLRFRLRKGAITGDKLHAMLEHLNFSQPNWDELAQDHGHHSLFKQADWQEVQHWFSEILATPILTHCSLGQLPRHQTLREAEFYFPVHAVNIDALTTFLQQFRQQLDPNTPPIQLKTEQLHGMMHGFIDLIFEWQGRYYVADYKSNHLGNHFQAYQPQQLQSVMIQHNYDLQYLIYSVALHRYLQHQLPAYQPEQDFGGVCYLFLRGMSPQHPGMGVYHQPLHIDTVTALDDIFKGIAP